MRWSNLEEVKNYAFFGCLLYWVFENHLYYYYYLSKKRKRESPFFLHYIYCWTVFATHKGIPNALLFLGQVLISCAFKDSAMQTC